MVIQIVLGTLFVVFIPPLDRQDEAIHWDYIRYLRENRRLPDQREQYVQDNPGEFWAPPLYYLLSTLIISPIPPSDPPLWIEPWNDFGLAYQRTATPDNANRILHDPEDLALPGRGDWLAFRILRMLSVLFGVLVMIPTFKMAWLVFEDDWLALGAAVWLGLRPALVSLNSRLNNDPLLLLLSTVILALCAVMIARGVTWRRAATMGVLLGITALTKFTWGGTALAVPIAFFLSPSWKENWKKTLAQFGLAGGISLLMTGWWFVRNQVLYGDVLGVALGAQHGAPGRPTFTLVRTSPITAEEVRYFSWRFFKDFWADFGVRGLPTWANMSLVVVTVLLLAGLIYLLTGGRFKQQVANHRVGTFFVLVSAIYLVQLVALFQVVVHGIKARYAYAGFAAMSIALHLGLIGLLEFVSRRWKRAPSFSIWVPILLLLPLSAYGVFGVIRPSYDLPHRVDDPAVLSSKYDTAANVRFGETIRLFGYSIDRRIAEPGDVFYFTVCWESGGPLDEAVPYGIHVVDQANYKAAELNTHPGLGMYPTLFWEPGVSFCDSGQVPISPDAPTPAVYQVVLKYFHLGTLEEIPATLENGEEVDSVILGEMALVPERWPDSGDARYLVGDDLGITRLDLSADSVTSGESLHVDVQWEALQQGAGDYTAFVHIFDADGEFVTQANTRPLEGTFPTSFWPKGAVVADRIEVPLTDLPEGAYRLLFGMYETETVTRLPLTEAGGEGMPDNLIDLGTVEVR
jgi:4-amino-4-deoxy-L-arabinose transferase-like glycosyltransferase